MNIEVVFEDANFIIINKPSGVVVHPFDFSTELTLVDFLQEKYKEIFLIENTVVLQDSRTISLGGIVHKLDRDTSGVMVIAKTQETFGFLKEQFRSHATQKTYIALVGGIVNDNVFTIDAPLGRNKKEYKQTVNPSNPRGELREAITDVEVLEQGNMKTLVKLYPKTGRTHQLRAHMAYIGHPIVGDKAYGGILDSERIMLHAESLGFSLEGKDYEFKVDTPTEFTIFLKQK
jgi:23S rRNA pseudouridine1911/1915/1917 synthase